MLNGALDRWNTSISQRFRYPDRPFNNRSQAMAPKNGGNMYGMLNNARISPLAGISLRPRSQA